MFQRRKFQLVTISDVTVQPTAGISLPNMTDVMIGLDPKHLTMRNGAKKNRVNVDMVI